MKKLNRKGFTLVELLAVIIILAIVVGISIPAITNIINDSKNNSLGVAVNAAEKFVADQYAFMQVDNTNVSKNFATISAIAGQTTTTGTGDEAVTTPKEVELNSTAHEALLTEMGLDPENVTTVTVSLTANGVACVKVTKIPTSSQYYTTKYWTAGSDGATVTANAGTEYESKSCQ